MIAKLAGIVWRWAALVIVLVLAFLFVVFPVTGWLRFFAAVAFVVLVVSYVTCLRIVDDLKKADRDRRSFDTSRRNPS